MELDLLEEIKKAQEGDLDSMEYLVEVFQPLLIKYSYMLEPVEDTKSELTLYLMKVIRKIPLDRKEYSEIKYILGYIKTSIRRHYIYLSSVKQREENTEQKVINDYETFYYSNSNIVFYDLIKNLNNKEKFILEKKFVDDYSNSDIAKILDISRQNVQVCIKRALYKLKKEVS